MCEGSGQKYGNIYYVIHNDDPFGLKIIPFYQADEDIKSKLNFFNDHWKNILSSG